MADSLHIVCPACGSTNRVPSDKLQADGKCGKCHEPLFPGKPVALSQAQFEQHLTHSDIPLLVDFWAAWCAPCRMMAPAFEQAAQQLEPYVRLGKIDTEREQAVAMKFGIRSIPTLILFKDGNEASRVSGAMDLRRLLAWTRQYL